MSEHQHSHTRYWKRAEQDDTIVYFFTESNAAHSRAESDSRAVEIDQQEYENNVTEEVRSEPYNVDHAKPASEVPKPQMPEEVIKAYQMQSAQHMVRTHQMVHETLRNAPITHAERVFILEMVKFELQLSLMQPIHPVPPIH